MEFSRLSLSGYFFILIWVLSVDYPVVINEKYPIRPHVITPWNRTVEAGVWNSAKSLNDRPSICRNQERRNIGNRALAERVWS